MTAQTDPTLLWPAAPQPMLSVRGSAQRAPVERLFFVGRNYAAHAAEMGFSVDKAGETPFYFTKSPHALLPSGTTVVFPPGTRNYHHEMELVVVLGRGGFEVPLADAPSLIYGYACGLDMTRRDLQNAAKEKGRPWDLGKDVEEAAVVSDVLPMPGVVLTRGAISLAVNGQMRQQADLSQMVWTVPELIADLSRFYHLRPGDLIFTGTPEGVGPVQPGDVLQGQIEGVGDISLNLAA